MEVKVFGRLSRVRRGGCITYWHGVGEHVVLDDFKHQCGVGQQLLERQPVVVQGSVHAVVAWRQKSNRNVRAVQNICRNKAKRVKITMYSPWIECTCICLRSLDIFQSDRLRVIHYMLVQYVHCT
jgi:hypothetical protein